VAEKPHDAVVKFDTCRNLHRHRALLRAIAVRLLLNSMWSILAGLLLEENTIIVFFSTKRRGFSHLDQELISYRYSPCVVVHVLVLLVLFFFLGNLFKKSLSICRFKSNREEICKYASIDGGRFLDMTSYLQDGGNNIVYA